MGGDEDAVDVASMSATAASVRCCALFDVSLNTGVTGVDFDVDLDARDRRRGGATGTVADVVDVSKGVWDRIRCAGHVLQCIQRCGHDTFSCKATTNLLAPFFGTVDRLSHRAALLCTKKCRGWVVPRVIYNI